MDKNSLYKRNYYCNKTFKDSLSLNKSDNENNKTFNYNINNNDKQKGLLNIYNINCTIYFCLVQFTVSPKIFFS